MKSMIVDFKIILIANYTKMSKMLKGNATEKKQNSNFS